MIAARAHRVSQRRKPGTLNQCGVERELSAGHASGIEHIDVIRIARQFRFFEFFGLIYQLLNALVLRRIRRTMGLSDETVVGVLPGVHRSHAVEFPHLDRRKQVIHSKRVVRVMRQDLLES